MTEETSSTEGLAAEVKVTPQAAAGAGMALPSSPVRFILHATICCAGRIADNIVSLYTRTFSLDKEHIADFNRSTGLAHARQGQPEKAIPMLESTLDTEPADEDVRMILAEAYFAVKQYESAKGHLEKLLTLSPGSARTVRALGFLYSRNQEYDRAIEYLEKAVKLDGDNAKAWYRLGLAYDNRKQFDKAVESFKQAIVVDPRLTKVYQSLGFTYESMGERESAVECFKKALELES